MSNTISTPSSTKLSRIGAGVEKRVAPAWIRKLVNPFIEALLRSRWHRLLSGSLILITYRGRKSGKSYTHPIFYFECDTDELLACTRGRWWLNVRDGKPFRMLVKGQELEAIPTIIRDRDAIVNAFDELIKRLG